MSAPLPPGVRVRTAPTDADVVRLRQAYLRRNALQVRVMRLTANLMVVVTLVFAGLSLRARHPGMSWVVTGACAVFAVLSRLLARTVTRPIDAHFARPVTTVFTDDVLYIDDEDDVWTIPYADVVRLRRGKGVNEVHDSAGGVTLLPLAAIPADEVARFTS